jgi:hypothetical protein
MTRLDQYEKKLLEAKQRFEVVVLKLQEVQYELEREDVEYAFEIAEQVAELKMYEAFQALKEARWVLNEMELEAQEERELAKENV